MAGIVIYHKRKFMIPKRNVLLGMAALSSLMTLFMLIIASVVTAGLKQTCSQFISLTGVPCADVFADGFFANDATTRYSKNLGTVSAAIGAAWATLISWAILTVYQWIQWRNEAQRWW